ncbi:Phospholipase B-like 1 [Tetrabaena socialis]|uniref:Phospholipase B-like n=1 Tax=Tetrabaena socialis TaxID=47790 RepID=A0A2J8AIU2_9CHLO|nr:Phospholipase B-like 1 [Tetrabaena socialis]|eukprot:PNH12428.1 Phospholipase B-like 1 [Tetrabaena socialis]
MAMVPCAARVGVRSAGPGGRAALSTLRCLRPLRVLVLAVALLTVTVEGSRRVCGVLRNSKEVAQGCVVRGDGGGMKFVAGHAGEDCIASGTFLDSSFTSSNFGKLRVVTQLGHSDADQAFAAGYLEGYLTAARMYDHHYNLKTYFNTMLNETTSLEEALDWLEVQEKLSNEQMRQAPPSDPYWRLLALVQAQFEGLVEGYQARAREEARLLALRGSQQQQQQRHGGGEDTRRRSRRLAASSRTAAVSIGGGGGSDVTVGWLERRDIMFLNGNGDVYDIIDALEAGYGRNAAAAGSGNSSSDDGGDRLPSWAKLDDDPLRMALKLGLQGKCSALIKVTGDLGELLMGHSTHDSFTAMTRIYKHYDFGGLADAAVVAKQVSFSSYPGELFSDDDFYLLSSGLVVLETTNHIYQGDIFRALRQDDVVLSWQRIRLANWMAGSGEEWIELFSRHNSGTYNNQPSVGNLLSDALPPPIVLCPLPAADLGAEKSVSIQGANPDAILTQLQSLIKAGEAMPKSGE